MKGVLESLVRGLGNGSVYALLALGFVIVYKATRVISFAQPAFMIAGAVAVSHLAGTTGFYLAVPLAALLVAGLALGVERVAIRPMVGRPVFVVAIITLGIDVVVRVVVNGFIGLDVRQVGDPWGLSLVEVGGLAVQQRWIAMLLTTAVLVSLLFAFFRYTRYGLAMRAAAFDQETALAQGVSVGMVFALSWALAGGLAAIAGTFAGTGQGVDQLTWIIALKALPAIIVGGLDSLGGAVIGGLAIGVVESLVQSYQGDLAPWLGQNFAVVTPYAVMLLVLLVRPYGLFGTPEVERV
ncbi:branched-chain amino acid ABC transporter permease [Planomonospora venezuelensis]|uniref:Branched-chain amino acid transport system permease protein n=1 Tax=Planomonospora venezuelensis TaxID=1999 RepID=A0A841DCA4_PLAVE|nr:branched-chain amino acid ABC transporter permease [Planomonospora venezuelensis]MBB5964986.1 branched-chain amino acid transport system permease protein [Planomonospora venezuelensis]GIN05456.1 branched-chain amino acid ABC transporter permease [Planomonospora venezuelensis]